MPPCVPGVSSAARVAPGPPRPGGRPEERLVARPPTVSSGPHASDRSPPRHRHGAHQLTVHDTLGKQGREAVLITEGHILHITTSGEGPHLTPEMAQELGDQLHQWAVCQQTVRTKVPKPVPSPAQSQP